MYDIDDKKTGYSTKEAQITRGLLLEAAQELFARHGFDGTAIRDITSKAGRNIASINYFFGDKRELYEELFRLRLREMRESRLNVIKMVMSSSSPSIEKLFFAYCTDFLKPFADPQKNQTFMRLFLREMAEQRLAKNMFFNELAKPTLTTMEDALLAICPKLSKKDAFMSILSLTGQLVHLMQIKILFEAAQGHPISSINTDEAVKHIVKFSTAGLKAFVKGNRK